MHRVEFDPAQITDWMYIENGYLVGGYTTCLIRQRMTPEERQTYDFKAPYKFRELDLTIRSSQRPLFGNKFTVFATTPCRG